MQQITWTAFKSNPILYILFLPLFGMITLFLHYTSSHKAELVLAKEGKQEIVKQLENELVEKRSEIKRLHDINDRLTIALKKCDSTMTVMMTLNAIQNGSTKRTLTH